MPQRINYFFLHSFPFVSYSWESVNEIRTRDLFYFHAAWAGCSGAGGDVRVPCRLPEPIPGDRSRSAASKPRLRSQGWRILNYLCGCRAGVSTAMAWEALEKKTVTPNEVPGPPGCLPVLKNT